MENQYRPIYEQPPRSGKYLVGHRATYKVIYYLRADEGTWHTNAKMGWQKDPAEFGATHWMPLPEVPEQRDPVIRRFVERVVTNPKLLFVEFVGDCGFFITINGPRERMPYSLESYTSSEEFHELGKCGVSFAGQELIRKNAELEQRLKEANGKRDELAAWKESALAMERNYDLQKIGQLLNVPLGTDIRSRIQPGIERLLTRIGELTNGNTLLRCAHEAACAERDESMEAHAKTKAMPEMRAKDRPLATMKLRRDEDGIWLNIKLPSGNCLSRLVWDYSKLQHPHSLIRKTMEEAVQYFS